MMALTVSNRFPSAAAGSGAASDNVFSESGLGSVEAAGADLGGVSATAK